MNFADRMSLECMMNKGLYAKYQSAQKQIQKTTFQLKQQQYRDEIQHIVQRLLNEDNADTNKNEKENANKSIKDNDEEKNKTEFELVLHPKVINHFNDFVSACIENLDDYYDEVCLKEEKEEEECAPIFMEESDEEKYYGNNNYNNYSNNSRDNSDSEKEGKETNRSRPTKNIKSVHLFSVFGTDH